MIPYLPAASVAVPAASSAILGSSGGSALGSSVAPAVASAGTTGLLNFVSNLWNNHQNKKINQAQLDFQREMMEKQMWYNSPLHQREMLEEAGYSPTAYLQGAKAQGVGGSTPNVIPMQAYQTSDYFNSAMNSLYQRLAVEKSLKEKDVDIAHKELKLGIDKASVVDELNRRYGESQGAIINAQRLVILRDIDDLNLTIQKEFKRAITSEELRRLKESVNLIIDQQNSEKARQDVDYALASLYRGRNHREAKLLQPTIEKIRAEINELGERAEMEKQEGSLTGAKVPAYQHFFYSIMESQMNQGFAAEDIAKKMKWKIEQEIEHLDKENDWYEINQLRNIASDFSQMSTDAAYINNLKVSQQQKDEMFRERVREFDRRMSIEERDVFTKVIGPDGGVTNSVRYSKPRKFE